MKKDWILEKVVVYLAYCFKNNALTVNRDRTDGYKNCGLLAL